MSLKNSNEDGKACSYTVLSAGEVMNTGQFIHRESEGCFLGA